MNRRMTGVAVVIGTTLAGTAMADIAPRALTRGARTPESRCASPMCQNMPDDRDATTASSPGASGAPPPFSLALGLGASWFRTRVQLPTKTVVNLDPLGGRGGPGEVVIDSGGVALGPLSEPTYRDDTLAAYPTVSLTLDLQQPLVSIGELDLRVAERFSIASAPRVPGEDLSTLVGFADIVLGAHVADFPVQVGLGPALGVAEVLANHFSWHESVLIGIIGIVRVQLPGVPGTLDGVVRGTRLLASSPAAGSYRDAQLAFTLAL
jgi:hypothetical protein